MKKLLIGVIVLAIPSLFACSKQSDKTVIVKVNNTRVTRGDVKRQIVDLSPDALQLISRDEAARKNMLDDIIAYELVLQEARRQGLENMEFNKRQDALRKEMERRLQEEARNELVTTLLRKELSDKLNIAPTDAEVKEFYSKYRDKMVTADGRRVSLQDATPEIKDRLVRLKQRDIYMEYANQLRDKARISINDDALKSLAGSLAPTSDHGGLLQQLPAPDQGQAGKTR